MKFWIPFFNDYNAHYEDDEDDESYEPAAEAPDVDDFNDDNRGVAGMKQSTNINRCLFASLGFVESSSHVLRTAEEKKCIPTKSDVTKACQALVSCSMFVVVKFTIQLSSHPVQSQCQINSFHTQIPQPQPSSSSWTTRMRRSLSHCICHSIQRLVTLEVKLKEKRVLQS